MFRTLAGLMLLSGVVLLMNVWAQASEKVQIAFSSERDGNYEIYVMDADGNNQRRLTNNPANESGPSWSPDGQKIAFVSTRDGNCEIYVMDADGKNQRNLTNHPADDASVTDWFDPAFAYPVSPAGKLRATWGQIKQNSE